VITMSDSTPSQQGGGQSNGHHNSKIPRVLACVLCQHRKIKCDRNTPCSNCLKANVPCTPSTPAPVRKRRRPNQDLQERLARCEALLKQYANTSGPLPDGMNPSLNPGTPASSVLAPSQLPYTPGPISAATAQSMSSAAASPTPGYNLLPSAPTPAEDKSPKPWKPSGKLVVEDGSVKFMDSHMWTIIHENVAAMRAILDAEAMDEASPFASDAPTPDDNVDLLLNDFASIDLEDVVPSPVQIFRLWQVFLERVNPLSKLVHVPTLQPIVVEAAANHRNVANNIQALLFSIYLISTITMSETESRQMLDTSRNEAIKKFTIGVKSALTRVNFLKNYDMTTLQALVLYLISLQGRYNRHAAWVLSGVLIRIAHKMGLHRDGETLNLTAFEIETRRRVWWQILMLDSKFALVSGFNDTLLPWGWDTKIPSNVNDADLFPGSTEPLQPREGPTEMIFCILLYEIGKFISQNRLPDFEEVVLLGQGPEPGTAPGDSIRASLDRYNAMVDGLEERLIAIEQRYLDISAGPTHLMSSRLRPMILDKIRHMLIPMRETPEWGSEVFNVQDNIFRISLFHQEHNLTYYELQDNQSFLWFHKLHFQFEVFAFLVGQLYQRRQTGSLADRMWNVIDKVYMYHEELWDMSQKQYSELAAFIVRAWAKRERALTSMCTPFDVPVCVPKLQDRVPQPSSGASSNGPSPAQPGHMEMPHLNNGGAPHTDGQLDFLGNFFDNSPLDWDMWGDMGVVANGNLGSSGPTTSQPGTASGVFSGFGNFGTQPPPPRW
ncbi:hypothetical protein BN1708_008242, partial [Verticillium longisporum]